MRFNDLMQTVLAAQARTGIGAITLWRQCVDMLAQYDRHDGTVLTPEDCVALIVRLESLRESVSETQRIASVVELGSRLRSPALISFFSNDRPSVCVAAMARATMPDEFWPAILPQLTPTARGVLRGRRDMGPLTRRALESFGKSDLVLSMERAEEVSTSVAAQADPVMDLTNAMQAASVAPSKAASLAEALHKSDGPTPDPNRSQIRDLVERIERYTNSNRPKTLPPEPATMVSDATPTPRHFTFETDAVGSIIWVGEASRTALIGLSIAEPALPGESGADGHIAGAFTRRSSFQHGRLWISDGPYGGEWRLSAIPFFEQKSGRFQGYRGQARRPHLHEVPHAPRMERERREAISLDSMRQLIHELRTPLNAILGFAEIIEQQLFGPADVHYREMAGNILVDARRLLGAFDDLDLASRANSDSDVNDARAASIIEIEPLIAHVTSLFNDSDDAPRGSTRPHYPRIHITTAASLPAVSLDPVKGERMMQHLMRTLMSVTPPEESLFGSLWFQPDGDGGHVLLALDRPARLKGLDEEQML
ncbi:MAG: histidine kinase dimerization/phospho-acceptor domain-containing protein, partial [Sphingobium sp.]